MEITYEEEEQIRKTISDIYNFVGKKKTYFGFNIDSGILIKEKVINILKREPAVLKINTKTKENKFIVVGDIHGDLESLLSIFKKEEEPSKTKYLFLGDFVDRGPNSAEVIVLLYAYKCLYPNNIYLIRGNHEFESMNNEYGFKDECFKRDLRGQYFYKRIIETYPSLPICAILDDKIFCVHGGISSLIKNRKDLMNIRKIGNEINIFSQAQNELIWNDPSVEVYNFVDSPRGTGYIFGERALKNFLKEMDFEFVIRGHQNEMFGFNYPFGVTGGILTIFSAVNYCDTYNEGAYVKMEDEKMYCDKIEIYTDNDDDFDSLYAMFFKNEIN